MRIPKPATLILSALALLTAMTARPARAAWALGPLGGATLSHPDIDGHASQSVTSWDIGARLQMGVAPILSIMFDPMVVQNKSEFDASAVKGRGDFTSIDVPMLLNARLTLLNLGVYGFLGPDLVFTTDANGNVASQNDLTQNDVNPVVVAGQVGAGLALGVAPFIDLTADARYTHGLNDLIDQTKGDVNHWRTRDVRLNMGILLHTPRMGALFRPGNAFRGTP